MVMRASVVYLVVGTFACGVISNEGDGGSNGADVVLSDAAQGFQDRHAPIPGEYEPTNGKPCDQGGNCTQGVDFGSCDQATGWCCEGYPDWTGHSTGCFCGNGPGCAPPLVCCITPNAQTYNCALTDACWRADAASE